MSTFENFYDEVLKEAGKTQQKTFDYDCDDIQSKDYNFHNDFIFWIELVEEETEKKLLNNALKEYLISQILLTQGFYRHSFVCLRSFLEQTLFSIQLSVNKMYMRQWEIGKKDVRWSEIVNSDTGIFSKQYVECFYPPACDNIDEFLSMSIDVYRLCSEFVHGNSSTYEHTVNLTFREETFLLWHDVVEKLQFIVLFALFIRYNELINTKEVIGKAEHIVLGKLNHIVSIRQYFEKEL